jgi:hypothetical protein
MDALIAYLQGLGIANEPQRPAGASAPAERGKRDEPDLGTSPGCSSC